MYKKMLIPLDRSELAEVVFPHAEEIAGRLGLELVLIHVASQEEHDRTSIYKPYLDRVAEILLNRAHYVQRSAGAVDGKATARVQSVLTAGHPAEEILRYTEQNDVDLILMATHGRTGISRWALGSVADKILRRSNVPVWLIRAKTSGLIEYDKCPTITMLVPLDGSKLAESVLPHVEALAEQKGIQTEVVLIMASELPLIEHIDLRKDHEQYLIDVAQRLSASGLNVRSEVLTGDPAVEIIEYANKNPINLIVMATHGRSGLSRWAYGSVADKVLRRASCPLFLVRVAQAFW